MTSSAKLIRCQSAARHFTLRLDSCTESAWFQQAGGCRQFVEALYRLDKGASRSWAPSSPWIRLTTWRWSSQVEGASHLGLGDGHQSCWWQHCVGFPPLPWDCCISMRSPISQQSHCNRNPCKVTRCHKQSIPVHIYSFHSWTGSGSQEHVVMHVMCMPKQQCHPWSPKARVS